MSDEHTYTAQARTDREKLAEARGSLAALEDRYEALRADLARALPVVEAAGRVVEHFGPSGGAQMTAVARRLLDALVRELDAGKGTG